MPPITHDNGANLKRNSKLKLHIGCHYKAVFFSSVFAVINRSLSLVRRSEHIQGFFTFSSAIILPLIHLLDP